MKPKIQLKSFQHRYTSPYCHHIVSIHQHSNPIPQHSGHLFLSGIDGLKKPVVQDYSISSVLTIMDKWTYDYDQVDKHIQQNNLIGHHHWINLQDTVDQSIRPHIDKAIEFIQNNIEKKNVLVHCHMGISRSASIVLAYLMKKYGMTLQEAHSHTVGIRDIIEPNQSFWRDLQRYEKVLKNEKI